MKQESDRELVVTRTFDGPARIVFEAWTNPELIRRWWVPKSSGMKLLSCAADVRIGGTYRFVFEHGTSEMAFFGRYLEVVPNARLVWTNDEAGDAGQVTTVTFAETGGTTQVVVRELYPSKEAFEAARGAEAATMETFAQLDELLDALARTSA